MLDALRSVSLRFIVPCSATAVTYLLVGPGIREEVWVAGARIVDFAPEVLFIVAEGCF
jgi:hypothetical protein